MIGKEEMGSIKIVIISDTHGYHEQASIPDGDILIHAGDLTKRGALNEVAQFNDFMGKLPHPKKIVIAGNHDFSFEREPQKARALMTNCIYLEDKGITINGINFYGSPWQPRFFDWAFNLDRGPALRQKWELIPEFTDVLITHGPPTGYGDKTVRGDAAGCDDLLQVVRRIKPRLHIFGHIHEGYGSFKEGNTTFINASVCNLQYSPINPAHVFPWVGK
jgi:Icc-related predicted phosphoesterase